MGNDDIIAFRTREQPRKYLGILLVMAVAYFAAGWLGKKVKLDALAKHVAKVSRKMFEVPEFFYYAIADGLRWLFIRHGKWKGLDCARERNGDLQMEFELLSG